jgi:hypothetical protein
LKAAFVFVRMLAAAKVVYKETFFLIRLTQKVNKNSVA